MVNLFFDVFSLGKLLWVMVFGVGVMNLWYYDLDDYNVEKLLFDNKEVYLINCIFEKCVVEYENDCMFYVGVFLGEIDRFIRIYVKVLRLVLLVLRCDCIVCLDGEYVFDDYGYVLVSYCIRLRDLDSKFFWFFLCNSCGYM